MLHLVDKERFDVSCQGKRPRQRIDGTLEGNISWPYYEIPEKSIYILYLRELEVILVFGDTDIQDSDIQEGITYDDWNLTKVSDRPDQKYILNLMKRCNHLSENFDCESGSWKLENTRIGKTIEFSVKVSGTYYKSRCIGYLEKLEIPINESKTLIIDKLIDTVYYGIRKNSTKNNIGSK